MQTREWILTAGVIIVPLVVAIAVTLWSIEQARYRRKKPHPAPREAGVRSKESGVRSRQGDEARAPEGATNGRSL